MLNNLHIEKLVDILKEDEGFRAKMYKCTNKVLTIGYGFSERSDFLEFHKELLAVNSFYEIKKITETNASLILEFSVIQIDAHMSINNNWYDKLTQVQKMVVVSLIFNIGERGFFKFKRMIKALKNGGNQVSTRELLDSKYYTDVKGRAIRLGLMLFADDADIKRNICDNIYNNLKKRWK